MCIIGIKETGTPVIPENVLDHCWKNNGNGAGFAYWNEDKDLWSVEKGFMAFDDFMEAFTKHNFTKDSYYMVHFRFATSGNKDGGNTHPFPLFTTLEEMRTLKFDTKYLAFHNGTCGLGEGIYSDTMVCINKYINPLYQVLLDHPEYSESIDPIFMELIRSESDRSRWALTDGGNVTYYGNSWERDDTKVLWSNGMYKFATVTPRHPNNIKTTKVYYVHGHEKYVEEFKGLGRWDSHISNFVKKDTFDKIYMKDGKLQFPYEIYGYSGKYAWNNYNRNWGDDAVNGKEKVEDYKPIKTEKVSVGSNGKLILPFDSILSSDFSKVVINDDGILVWDKEEDKYFLNIMCPSCYMSDDLEKSPYGADGQLLCNNCGAIFEQDTGEVITMDDTIIVKNAKKVS